jgi:putative transposase
MSEESKDKLREGKLTSWAALRFSIVGGLLARPPEKGELGQRLQALANDRYRHPVKDEWVKFARSTIERWYYRSLKTQNPLEALGRKIRSDNGKSYAMSGRVLDILRKQYEHYPQWSYRLHADNLAVVIKEQPELGDCPSYSTIVRRMKERGWYKKGSNRANQTEGQKQAMERLEKLEVRSFESEYVHALWHLDFHEGRKVVDAHGKWHTSKALCILDDRSRLVCHIQWYLDETAQSLIHGLSQAFHKRGLPRALMTDNGPAMIANETQNGLLRLGISHEKILPYSPYQNGKQESFWGRLEGRLMAMLSQVESLTLEFLNRVTQAWVEMEYNRSWHEDISSYPLARLLQGPDVSRPSPDSNTLRFAFTVQEKRKQRKSDGTIPIKGVRFEVPSAFRHFEHLFVQYQSWDLGQVYLVDQRTGSLLANLSPQDKTKNANGHRRPLQSASENTQSSDAQSPPAPEDPIPPLLRKILADYAATGLPPAYLPTQESVPAATTPITDQGHPDRTRGEQS